MITHASATDLKLLSNSLLFFSFHHLLSVTVAVKQKKRKRGSTIVLVQVYSCMWTCFNMNSQDRLGEVKPLTKYCCCQVSSCFFSSLQLCFITAFNGLSNPKYILFLWSLVLIIHPDCFVVSCSYWLYSCLPSFQYNSTKRHYHYYYYATNIYSLMSSWRGLWKVL